MAKGKTLGQGGAEKRKDPPDGSELSTVSTKMGMGVGEPNGIFFPSIQLSNCNQIIVPYHSTQVNLLSINLETPDSGKRENLWIGRGREKESSPRWGGAICSGCKNEGWWGNLMGFFFPPSTSVIASQSCVLTGTRHPKL